MPPSHPTIDSSIWRQLQAFFSTWLQIHLTLTEIAVGVPPDDVERGLVPAPELDGPKAAEGLKVGEGMELFGEEAGEQGRARVPVGHNLNADNKGLR